MGKKKKHFTCVSEEQKMAIRANYARKARQANSVVDVTIKDHKDKNGGHPHIIVDSIDKKHVSVGLSTQKKKGKGKKSGTNYTMDKSPLNDGKHSYMRRQGIVAPIGEYENQRKGTMTSKDYAQAKVYGERAKEKYLVEKENKKK